MKSRIKLPNYLINSICEMDKMSRTPQTINTNAKKFLFNNTKGHLLYKILFIELKVDGTRSNSLMRMGTYMKGINKNKSCKKKNVINFSLLLMRKNTILPTEGITPK